MTDEFDQPDEPYEYEKTEIAYFIERKKDNTIITLTITCAKSIDGEDYLGILKQFIDDHMEVKDNLFTDEHSTEVECH